MVYCFYRSLLPENCREAYDKLRRGLLDLDTEIDMGRVDSGMLNTIMNYVINDEPIVYYCDSFSFTQKGLTKITIAQPHYTLPFDQIRQYTKAIRTGLKGIVGNVRATTEAETVAKLHDFICKKFTYVNADFYSHGIYGAICRRKAVCDGIAETFKLACDELGIASIIVKGEAFSSADGSKPGPHAWNKVCINGVWYNMDATYDLSLSKGEFVRHDYYLVSDDEIAFSHKPNQATVACRKKCAYYSSHSLLARSPGEMEDIIAARVKPGIGTDIEIDVSAFCGVDDIKEKTQEPISRGLSRKLKGWSVEMSYNSMRGIVALRVK